MRVKMRTIMAGDFGVCQPGDCIEVPDAIGEELLRSRQAEPADPLPCLMPADDDDDEADDAPETATNAPQGETAVAGRKARAPRVPKA